MRLTWPVRLVLIFLFMAGGLAYAVLVELAINAGRVHRGVTVGGFDVGGMNRAEAEAALDERGEEMKRTPMVFTGENFECRFTPADIGWGPQEFETVNAAMAVGRAGSWFDALRQRVVAWVDGVEVEWADVPDAAKVGRQLNRCEDVAAGSGEEIDRAKLRYRIKKAVVTWPRTPVSIPLGP